MIALITLNHEKKDFFIPEHLLFFYFAFRYREAHFYGILFFHLWKIFIFGFGRSVASWFETGCFGGWLFYDYTGGIVSDIGMVQASVPLSGFQVLFYFD